MKITTVLLMLLVLFLPNILADEYTQRNLPEGAIACFGKGTLREVLYSPDGARIAVVGGIGIYLYDTATYREVALLTGHKWDVRTIAFSPDGKTLASGSVDMTVRLCDTVTGQHKQTLTGHTGTIYHVVFSPDGKVLASASLDDTVRLWDTETWELKNPHGGWVPVHSVQPGWQDASR